MTLGTGEKGTHQELEAKFLREHIPQQWQDADDLGKRINEPLISIFSEINLGIDQQNKKWRIPLKILSLDENSLFPKIEDGNLSLNLEYIEFSGKGLDSGKIFIEFWK
jgi:hypothetical protein